MLALLTSELALPSGLPLVAFRAGERLHPVYEALGEIEPQPRRSYRWVASI